MDLKILREMPAALAGRWRRAGRRAGHLWPSECVLCRAWPSPPLCDTCVALYAAPQRRCLHCALPCPPDPGDEQACPQCRRHPPALDRCVAAVDYAWPWPDLIARLKFQGHTAWATPLSWLMLGSEGASEVLEDADWVLPTPLSPERLAERGYNQAALLAQALCHATSHPGLRLDGLIRGRHTAAQSGLSRAERMHNLQEAFLPNPLWANALRSRHVLLVDDVCTTGATLEAATLALRQAGVRRVSALVLARTGRSEPTN